MMIEYYLDARVDHLQVEQEVPTFGFFHDFDLHQGDLVSLNWYLDWERSESVN